MILEPLTGSRAAQVTPDTPLRSSRVPRSRAGSDEFPVVMAETAARDNQTVVEPLKRPSIFWQNETFGLGDIVDIVNPLQHIPVVATIYRKMTGDGIGALPRVLGGALWGRLGGMVAGVVNSVLHWFTGKDIGDHVLALLDLDGPSQADQSRSAALPAELRQQSRSDRQRDAAVGARPVEIPQMVRRAEMSDRNVEESAAPTPALPPHAIPAQRLEKTYAVGTGADASLLPKHRLTINA